MNKSISCEIADTWEQLVPKVLDLARHEVDNFYIEELLKDIPTDLSNGKSYIKKKHLVILVRCFLHPPHTHTTPTRAHTHTSHTYGTHTCHPECRSILALCLLYHLLPDTRARPDHSRVVKYIKVCMYDC